MGDQPASIMVERVLEQLSLPPNDVDDLSGTLASYLTLNRTDLRALKVLRQSDGVTAGLLARSLRRAIAPITRVIDTLAQAEPAQRETHSPNGRPTESRV